MKALRINTEAKRIEVIDLPDEDDQIGAIQDAVGGYFESVGKLASGDILYVDEEGLCKENQPVFEATRHDGQRGRFVGNALICGTKRGGATAPVKMTLADAMKVVKFL